MKYSKAAILLFRVYFTVLTIDNVLFGLSLAARRYNDAGGNVQICCYRLLGDIESFPESIAATTEASQIVAETTSFELLVEKNPVCCYHLLGDISGREEYQSIK